MKDISLLMVYFVGGLVLVSILLPYLSVVPNYYKLETALFYTLGFSVCWLYFKAREKEGDKK